MTADWGRRRGRQGGHNSAAVGEGTAWGGGEQAGVADGVKWGRAKRGGRWHMRESQQPAAGEAVLASAENKWLRGQSQRTPLIIYLGATFLILYLGRFSLIFYLGEFFP